MVILSENGCHFGNLFSFKKELFLSQLEVKHMSQQPKTDTDVDNLGVRIGSR